MMSKGDRRMWTIMRYILASEGPNRIIGLIGMAISPLFSLVTDRSWMLLEFSIILFVISIIQAMARYLFLDMFGEEAQDDKGL